MELTEALLTIALFTPVLLVLLLASFYVNYQSILVLRRERKVAVPPTLRKGHRKLFVISTPKD